MTDNGVAALAERLDGALAQDRGGGFVESSASIARTVLSDGSRFLSREAAERARAALREIGLWDCGQPAAKFNEAYAALRAALEPVR